MKFNKIKTLTMVVAVLTLGTFAGCGKEDTKTVIKYVEAVPSPAVTQAPVSVEEPTEEPSTLTHDEIINGIKTILQNNWEYSDVDYNVNSDTLHAYISKPQITSSMNKIPYSVRSIIDNPTLRGIHNILGNLVDTKDEYVSMLEVALGASSNNIVVNDITNKFYKK